MGLMDIAPPEIITKHFEIRGGTLDVRGIKTREWVLLQRRFPELRAGLNGEVTEDVVMTAVDGLVPAVIAAGLGTIGDEETERLIVERLSDSEQIMIFGAIMELTAPEPQNKSRKSPLAVSPPIIEPLQNRAVDLPTMNLQDQSLL